MKKNFVPIAKIINVMMIVLPFLLCWGLYYEPRALTTGFLQVSLILVAMYMITYYHMARRLDGFRFQIAQARDMAFGQIIAIGVVDCATFLFIWMLSVHFPHLWPGLIAFTAQCVSSILWAKYAHNLYFKIKPPLKSAVVYDVRQGMENLVNEYGLEKRYDIQHVYPVEEVLQDMSLLDGHKEVFIPMSGTSF